ncbi:AfsR/SARP family transcriptional regulator [Actinosynnema sp. CA-248983]
MTTEFKVLGPLEVWHDGKPVPVPVGRVRVLLASLLLHANEVVSTDVLVDRLWDGAPPTPARARATLHMVVTRLRQALGPANVVRTAAGGRTGCTPRASPRCSRNGFRRWSAGSTWTWRRAASTGWWPSCSR